MYQYELNACLLHLTDLGNFKQIRIAHVLFIAENGIIRNRMRMVSTSGLLLVNLSLVPEVKR